MSPKTWYAAEVSVSSAAREAIEYGLMEAGALGTETVDVNSGVRIAGYFDRPIEAHSVRHALLDGLRIYGLESTDLRDFETREVPDRDWLAEWKQNWQPVSIGRFIVAPPWIESFPTSSDRETEARIILKIEPGMAFGTGTHETTRLCLQAIERQFRGGSFLDVGTGTGILAIAAAKMFPNAHVEACDTDAEAVEIAKENARLNGVDGQIQFRAGTVDERTASADLVCANLTAPVIVDLLPQLLGATCGRLILSGILDSQIEVVQARLFELGTTILESDQQGEWVSLVV